MPAHVKHKLTVENKLPSQMLALEPRYLFDAAALATVVDVAIDPAVPPPVTTAVAADLLDDGQFFLVSETAPPNSTAFEITGGSFGDDLINKTPGAGALTYTVTGGTGMTAFDVTIDGAIRVINPSQLDFESNPETPPSFTLIVQAEDGSNNTDSTTITIVIANTLDEAPEINATVADETVLAGTTLTKNIKTEADPTDDDEGDPINYTLLNPPSNASIDYNTGVFTWNTGPGQTGIHTITVLISNDGDPDQTTPLQFDVTVTNNLLDDGQFFLVSETAPPNSTAFEITGGSFGDDLINKTPGAGALTYTVTGGTGMTAFDVTIDGAIRVINPSQLDFESNPETPPSFTLIVQAEDGSNNTDSTTITIVIANTLDEAPEINATVADETVLAGTTLTKNIKTEADPTDDDEGDPINYTLLNPPSNASIDYNTGVFTWNTGPGQAGIYTITVLISNDGDPDQTTPLQFDVTVKPIISGINEATQITGDPSLPGESDDAESETGEDSGEETEDILEETGDPNAPGDGGPADPGDEVSAEEAAEIEAEVEAFIAEADFTETTADPAAGKPESQQPQTRAEEVTEILTIMDKAIALVSCSG